MSREAATATAVPATAFPCSAGSPGTTEWLLWEGMVVVEDMVEGSGGGCRCGGGRGTGGVLAGGGPLLVPMMVALADSALGGSFACPVFISGVAL